MIKDYEMLVKGEMLIVLKEAEKILPDLLREDISTWNSLNIDYEPPQVERLWRSWKEFRINLHKIYPIHSDEKALYHPHPWPSAVKVISGIYEMGVGYSEPGYSPAEVACVTLCAGSAYEMVKPKGWHYVRPIKKPSLSIMVTGKPFERQLFAHDKFGKSTKLNALTEERKLGVLSAFKELLCL